MRVSGRTYFLLYAARQNTVPIFSFTTAFSSAVANAVTEGILSFRYAGGLCGGSVLVSMCCPFNRPCPDPLLSLVREPASIAPLPGVTESVPARAVPDSEFRMVAQRVLPPETTRSIHLAE